MIELTEIAAQVSIRAEQVRASKAVQKIETVQSTEAWMEPARTTGAKIERAQSKRLSQVKLRIA